MTRPRYRSKVFQKSMGFLVYSWVSLSEGLTGFDDGDFVVGSENE